MKTKQNYNFYDNSSSSSPSSSEEGEEEKTQETATKSKVNYKILGSEVCTKMDIFERF